MTRIFSFLTATRGKGRLHWTDWVSYGYLLFGVLLMFGPVVWLVLSSFKTPNELDRFPPRFLPYAQDVAEVEGFEEPLLLFTVTEGDLAGQIVAQTRRAAGRAEVVLPDDPENRIRMPAANLEAIEGIAFATENYTSLFERFNFLRFFWNSAWVSIIVVTITMLISVPAAFALARMKFWGSATLATGVFLTYLIPDSLLFLPLFKMFAVFGDWTGIQLINRWYVLVFIYPTLTVPFCTWIMIGYFASIPKELDEAAIIDGASWFQTLTRIFIPVALPGLIAATIFAFTVSWAQFLYPLVFTTSTDQLVLPVGIITTLIKGDVFNWGQIMTGALLGAAPPLIIYAFLMDYYIAGLTAGATKG